MYIFCDKCSLAEYRDKNNYKMVWGDGNTAAKIFIIGEAPGEKEAKEGKPFIGRSGNLLREIMGKYFDMENDVFITNTILCRPPENRTPNFEEQNKCFSYIYSQIFTIKPKVVFTAGKVSSDWFERLTGKPYNIYNGKVIELGDSKILWIPIYHPSYLLRVRSKIDDFKACLEKYHKLIKRITEKA